MRQLNLKKRMNKVVIRKEGKFYVVRSERTGRNMGRYLSLEDAENRLRQIEFFKRRKKKKFATVRKHKRKGKKVRRHRRRLR